MYKFDAEDAVLKTVEWIQNWFLENGKDCKAVLGISGGKDSSIVAALLVKALGKDRVLGVLMPNGTQPDIDFAYGICAFLDIEFVKINIKKSYDALIKEISDSCELSKQAKINLAPRLRMSTVYAVSQCNNGRVANTCNYSEDYVGYSTRYGDSVGDFSPISCFTVTEVKQMAKVLGIPEVYYEKKPSDGLTNLTDEDNLGFTYDELDKYIREGIEPESSKKEKIDRLHKMNLFKLSYMPCFKYEGDK